MMKRFLLFLFLLIPVSLAAQFSAGVYGGVNNSKLRGDTPKDIYFRDLPSGDMGVFLSYNISELFKVSFQPYYTRKGTKVSIRLQGTPTPVDSARIFLSYISFPLVFSVITNKQRWYVLSGVEVSKPIHSYYKYVDGSDEKYDISDQVSKFNFYLSFGVGYRWPVGEKMHLFAELRYFQALINTIRAGSIDPAYLPRVRSRGTQLEAGIEFSLERRKKKNP
jgi:hypothetical protein